MPQHRHAFIVALLAVAFVPGALGVAALPQTATPQRPVFRSGVELVTLDVSVVDGAGKPIQGLGPEDFELEVDGARRRVVSAQFVRTGRTEEAPPIRSEHVTTNEHVIPGRLMLVAVDQMHIRRVEGRAALQAAAAFIDTLDRDDKVAAVPLNYAGEINFTTEHAVVKRHLAALSGTASPPHAFYNIGLTEALAMSDGSRIAIGQVVRRECGGSLEGADSRRFAELAGLKDPCPAQVELEGRSLAQQARNDTRMSLNALERLIVRLADVEGPKTIVLVSEGLVAEPQYFDLTALGAAAYAARVAIYVLQLETPMLDASDTLISPTASADIHVRGDGLARLAGSARGALFRLVGSDPQPFRRILSELSGYYLLAFEPEGRDRDGATHLMEVKVRTRRAVVRARPSFRNPGVLARDTTEAELVRLLRDPRPATGLPLRVSTYVYRQPDSEGLKVIVAAESSVREAVTVGFILVNGSGVIAASDAGMAPDGRYAATKSIPGGRYMLKAAVIGRDGRSGSVERHFDARLASAGGVPVGDLMLAEPATDGSAALQPVVVSLRGDQLVTYLELYAADDWSPGSDAVRVEVEAGEDGVPPVRIPAVVQRAGPGRWTVTARWPLDDLPPGARLAVVTVALPGAEPARFTRPFAVERKK
jgi:VWFA-related protein